MAYPQTSFVDTTFLLPSFISRRRQVVYENTLIYQLEILKNTGRYDAFKLKWHPSYNDKPNVWPVPNHLFWDSDIAKWIEGACYFLHTNTNESITNAVEELVSMIQAAQQEDGYLNIHFTVVDPGKRFTNLRDLHELYNAGHLIEAALAHNSLYKNKKLLDPILRYVDLLCRTFGPDPEQKHGYPGHPEIELALIRLYERTNNIKHLTLARYFITERGNPTGQNGRHYYDTEAEARGERENERPSYWPTARSYWYQQAHTPIVNQDSVEGHSVRAMYLLTSVADLIRIENNHTTVLLKGAVERLWQNMVEKKMYMTGGIGAQKQWEGFGIDYFLPSGTDEGGCYAETCAAIGVMMLAERLLQLDLDANYADIMELCFYNAVSTGISANGKEFTYINQLASSNSDLSKRAEWFTCACCPPNMTRLLGYIGGYLWTAKINDVEKKADINVHLYCSAKLSVAVGDSQISIQQSSSYPWSGDIEFSLENPSKVVITLNLRIPGWANGWMVDPPPSEISLNKGYLTVPQSYLEAHSSFRLIIPLLPRFIFPHPYSNQEIIALARGPVIYCLEDADNVWVDDHFKSLVLDTTSSEILEIPTALHKNSTTIWKGTSAEVDSETLEPYIALSVKDAAWFLKFEQETSAISGPDISLDRMAYYERPDVTHLNFTPYALRDNRGGKGHMRVGIKKRK